MVQFLVGEMNQKFILICYSNMENRLVFGRFHALPWISRGERHVAPSLAVSRLWCLLWWYLSASCCAVTFFRKSKLRCAVVVNYSVILQARYWTEYIKVKCEIVWRKKKCSKCSFLMCLCYFSACVSKHRLTMIETASIRQTKWPVEVLPQRNNHLNKMFSKN